MTEIESNELTKWFCDFIDVYRNEFSKLSKEEQDYVQLHADYTSPCQIEVFWLKDPSKQFIMRTKFQDLPDKEIIINGPYEKHEFISKVKPHLLKEKWQRSEKDDIIKHSRHLAESIYSEDLASQLHQFIERSKTLEYSSPPSSENNFSFGMMIGDLGWVNTASGNVAKLDFVKEALSEITTVKEDYQRSIQSNFISKKTQESDYDGFGIHFFPPIYVGEKPKFTIEQLLNGNKSDFSLYEKVLELSFQNKIVLVSLDGFIFLEEENRTTASRILNLIMSLGYFTQIPFYTFREHELAESKLDRDKMYVSGFTHTFHSPRFVLFGRHMGHEVKTGYADREIKPENIENLIKSASQIWPNQGLVDKLLMLSEAYTHLQHNEFSQSFLMSWVVLEKYFSEIWIKQLKEKKITGKRFDKLKNYNVDRILETLNLTDYFDDERYKMYNELKTKRNNLFHVGSTVDKNTAITSLLFAHFVTSTELPSSISDLFESIIKDTIRKN